MAWSSILVALWLFLPVFVANMSPVFTAKLIPAWKHPIDGGRMHRDGRRVLGDGKTWRGLILGGFVAGWTAIGMAAWAGGPFADADLGRSDGTAWWAIFAFGFVLGFMALIGDAVESYFKRRRGKERGAPWVPFDQLDFVVGGYVGVLLGLPLLPGGWALDAYVLNWVVPVTLLVGTPVLHLLVNRIGYWLRLKDVPW